MLYLSMIVEAIHNKSEHFKVFIALANLLTTL